jgi:tRNA (guanine37-N1)-methyltransferase
MSTFRFDIITIFPHIFDSYFQEGILKRAAGFKRKIKIRVHDLRKYTHDKHRTVDHRPYGGGPGMVLMAEPIIKAIVDIRKHPLVRQRRHLILFSAKGKPYNQEMARRLTGYDQIIMICGRYEGIDERVLNFVDEEISIGNYVLTGGEIPAMALVDSVSRLLPGVLGDETSNVDESHEKPGVLEYPHFTRPEILKLTAKQEKFFVRKKRHQVSLAVPKVLLSGNHRQIEEWRKMHRLTED